MIDRDKLRIYPAGTDKSKLRLELHNLKSMLPKVIVKVNKMSIVKFTAIRLQKYFCYYDANADLFLN